MSAYSVAVYGASAHTGRCVAAELERRSVAVRRIGRRAQSGWSAASCDEPEALDRALRDADAVINCAGPFADTAPAVIESALRVGAHYLDVAAEQRSVRQSLATYAAEAVDRGVVVLPAMAFYGGLADLLAARVCAGLRVVDEILIGVALDYWHPTARRWRFPEPFGDSPVASVPLSEIVTISRHSAARRIESFMNEAPAQDLKRADTPPPPVAISMPSPRRSRSRRACGWCPNLRSGEARSPPRSYSIRRTSWRRSVPRFRWNTSINRIRWVCCHDWHAPADPRRRPAFSPRFRTAMP